MKTHWKRSQLGLFLYSSLSINLISVPFKNIDGTDDTPLLETVEYADVDDILEHIAVDAMIEQANRVFPSHKVNNNIK